MNRDEGQYFLSHAFDEILMKKKHSDDLRQQLIAKTYTVSCFTWIRIWETFVYQRMMYLLNIVENQHTKAKQYKVLCFTATSTINVPKPRNITLHSTSMYRSRTV